MIKFLLRRPIAVFMAFTAFVIMGCITYNTLPVSLLPDISIPEITVQVDGSNSSARELENAVMRTLRTQLMQVEQLEDMRSETRDGVGLIKMRFDYGTNTDLAFIEVNEKIDAAMSHLPQDIKRPQVIKASATDIPVLYLNLTLNEEKVKAPDREERFLELSDLADNVIRRRIEQLPEVAMADLSGLTHTQVRILPRMEKMESLGIGVSDIERALSAHNVDPGSMTVRKGYYEYNIRFSTILRTVEDVRRIPVQHEGRIFSMADIADVHLMPVKESGRTLYNGQRAISIAIIKQAEENMQQMKAAINKTIRSLRGSYPEVEFHITRNQTELLDYTLTNLRDNLILGFLFIMIVATLFMKGIRSPLVIGASMVVALIICFIFFFLCDMSLNIISLSGLILAEGMMIDNAIIVTENIEQYRDKGYSTLEACSLGTEEVITPMLSSSLTTIAVFVPLVFISGIAGAIFLDEAMAVTIGLATSYVTGIILLPVLYKIAFTHQEREVRILRKIKNLCKQRIQSQAVATNQGSKKGYSIQRFYDDGIRWVWRHKVLTMWMTILSIPLCVLMFYLMPKERMPETERTEIAVRIDWNENIHIDDNHDRTVRLEHFCRQYAIESNAHVGTRQYLLEREQTSTTETDLYLRTATPDQPTLLQEAISDWLAKNYPAATARFYAPENVFEKIFDTNEADVIVELYNKDKAVMQNVSVLKEMEGRFDSVVGLRSEGIAYRQQLTLTIDRTRLMIYGVSYEEILQRMKTALSENQVTTLRSYQDYLPIVIGGEEKTIDEILNYTQIEIPSRTQGEKPRVPLRSFITVSQGQELRSISAGLSGEYIPLQYSDLEHPASVIDLAKKEVFATGNGWAANFSGAFLSSKQMIGELLVVLIISLLLMYFILCAQFESFMQPLIVLAEIPIDLGFALVVMAMCGISLNLMSAIGIVVSCGIIINDSILKLDMINVLRRQGVALDEAIHTAGSRRLRSIVMTSLTTIFAMVPLLFTHDMGSELQRPLAIAMIATMTVGTLVSLFFIPLIYWKIYKG